MVKTSCSIDWANFKSQMSQNGTNEILACSSTTGVQAKLSQSENVLGTGNDFFSTLNVAQCTRVRAFPEMLLRWIWECHVTPSK